MKKGLVNYSKKLGILIAINQRKITTGIITDGQIRRVHIKMMHKIIS